MQMLKKLMMYIPILIIFFTFNSLADIKSKKELSSDGRLKHRSARATEFVKYEAESNPTSPKVIYKTALNSTAFGTVVGETMWDEQQVRSMTRQIGHRGTGFLHLVWTDLDEADIDASSLDIAYNAIDLASSCDIMYSSDGIKGQMGRARNTSLDTYFGTPYPIFAAQTELASDDYPATFWDMGWQLGTPLPFGVYYLDYPTDIFGWDANPGTGPGNENLYPYIEMQNGTELVLHMTTMEDNSDKRTLSYYRRVGEYGFEDFENPNGTWSDQKVIDTVGWGDARVIASINSDKVAIVWMAPAAFFRDDPTNEYENGWLNDVYYIMSESQGADWMTNTPVPSLSQEGNTGLFTDVNITNYADPSAFPNGYFGFESAFTEVQGLFDLEDNLHVIWGTRISSSEEYVMWRDGAVWHWSENHTTPSLIYRPPELVQNPEAYCAAVGYNMQNVGGFSLAECIKGDNAGNLYVTFTRFGHDGNPCEDIDFDNPGSPGAGNLNGYLYYSASDNGGLSWDRPQRVTDRIPTYEGCSPDSTNEWACNTEVFGSLARYSRTETCGPDVGEEVLDLFYIQDLAPGGILSVSNPMFTNNPFTWFALPCRDIVPEAVWQDDLRDEGLGICYNYDWILVASPGETAYDTIVAVNPGLLDNNFNITVEYEDGDGWATANPQSGSIAPILNDTAIIELAFTAPEDAQEDRFIYCTININHDGVESPRQIPVCFWVEGVHTYPPIYDTLATTCKQVRINNTGRMSGMVSGASFNYIDECDTFGNADARRYLYDASLAIAWDDGEVKLCTDFYTSSPYGNHAFWPTGELLVDEECSNDYIYATGEFTTFDSSINCRTELYVPKGDTACEFIIQKYYITSASGPKNNVAIGYIWDLDVPSDSGFDNVSFGDPTRNLLYMMAEEADDDGEAESLAECGVDQQSNDRFAGVRILPTGDISGYPKNLITVDNNTWVYQTGPYGGDAPFPAGPTYDLMLTAEGIIPWCPAAPSDDSIYVDLSMLATFGEYNLTENYPVEIAFALITGRTGETDFLAEVDKAFKWAGDPGLIVGYYCLLAGDANLDWDFNVGDAVYLINNVFRGGPPPDMFGNADANGDCFVNVGDAVYIINTVFKGGPDPWCNFSCSPNSGCK